MKQETLEALQAFAEEVSRTIRSVADMGCGADTSALTDAKDRLWDALQNEDMGP